MLVTEKKITRVRTHLDDNEIASLNDMMAIADCFQDILKDNGAIRFVSTATGEVIEMKDLCRLKGILSGLNHCREWVLE